MYIDTTGKTGTRNLKGASGKTYGNALLLTPTERADMLADGIVEYVKPPKPQPTLQEIKDKMKAGINGTRESWLDSEYAEVEMDGAIYEADTQSRTNLNDILTALGAGVPVPDPFTFRDKANNNIPLSHAKLIELAALMVTFKETAYLTSWTLKQQIDDAPDQATLDATELVDVPVVDQDGNFIRNEQVEMRVIRWPYPIEPIVEQV